MPQPGPFKSKHCWTEKQNDAGRLELRAKGYNLWSEIAHEINKGMLWELWLENSKQFFLDRAGYEHPSWHTKLSADESKRHLDSG